MDSKIDKMRKASRLRAPQTLRTILALVMREMATSYGRSPGGYLWAIAEPIAGITLLSFIFSFGFRAPPIGWSFALFYATGVVPFLIYVDMNVKISQSINFSLPLLAYPRVTLVDAVLARMCLNAATQCLVAMLIFGALIVLIDSRSVVFPETLGLAVGLSICFGSGVGVLNCFLVTRFPVWQRVWSIANRPMFLLSCVVFTFDSVPRPFQDWLWFNPLVHLVGLTRAAFYPGYNTAYISVIYVLFTSACCAVVGFFLIWRYRDRLLNR